MLQVRFETYTDYQDWVQHLVYDFFKAEIQNIERSRLRSKIQRSTNHVTSGKNIREKGVLKHWGEKQLLKKWLELEMVRSQQTSWRKKSGRDLTWKDFSASEKLVKKSHDILLSCHWSDQVLTWPDLKSCSFSQSHTIIQNWEVFFYYIRNIQNLINPSISEVKS